MVGRTDVALIGRPAREATPTVAGRDVDDIPARRTPWNDRARSPLTQMRLVQAGGKCVIHHSMFWIYMLTSLTSMPTMSRTAAVMASWMAVPALTMLMPCATTT